MGLSLADPLWGPFGPIFDDMPSLNVLEPSHVGFTVDLIFLFWTSNIANDRSVLIV